MTGRSLSKIFYTKLKDTIGRSTRAEKEHRDNVVFGTASRVDNSNPDNLLWPLNTDEIYQHLLRAHGYCYG